MKRLRALYILDSESFSWVYGPDEQAAISDLTDLLLPSPLTRCTMWQQKSALSAVDVIFSGWGAPVLNSEFLAAAPNLKAVFYGAGSAGSILTEDVWERGIAVTTAHAANSIPVAEYCLAVILFSLKHGWRLARACHASRSFVPRAGIPGAFGTTVGLVSMGATATTLRKLLANFDVNVIAYDPFLDDTEAKSLNVRLLSLETLFRESDVISIHTPLFPETRGLISHAHMAAMKTGATLINTSRGEILEQDQLIAIASSRPDLQLILDVTCPEPPARESPIFDLPNVIITPHIAGSVENECRRMGRLMVDELKRFIAGTPLRWELSPRSTQQTVHRPLSTTAP